MNKKLLIIVLLCTICICVTGCSSEDWKSVKSDVRSSVKIIKYN